MIPTPLLESPLFTLFVFIVGACVGSFLNVCIHRLPREESVVRPRSHCPHCNHPIPGYDNIPLLSFFLLGAKCRHCGAPISIRYFVVELLTATAFALIWQHYGWNAVTPVYWLMTAGLILGSFVDFEHMIIPDRVTLGAMAAGLILSPLIPALQGASSALDGFLQALLGLVVGSGLLWSVAMIGRTLLKKDAMGMGDVKLLGGLGALLGWRAVLFTIMMGSVMGSLVGVTLILMRKGHWQSRIPFGPYMALAALIWILWGHNWMEDYMAWIAGKTF